MASYAKVRIAFASWLALGLLASGAWSQLPEAAVPAPDSTAVVEAEPGPAPEEEPAAVPSETEEAVEAEPAVVPEEEKEPAEAAPPRALPLKISAIRVIGNEKITAETILAAVSSKVGDEYSEPRAKQDVETIRNLGWFSEAILNQREVEGGIELVFQVQENPTISDIQFEGVTVFKPERLTALMKTKPGQLYNRFVFKQDITAIRKLFEDEGYILATLVDFEITADNVLKISFLEGRIAEVRILGNERTKEYVIRRELRMRKGEVFNINRLRADVGRLLNLGFFEEVTPTHEAGPELGTVIITIRVVEKKKTGIASVGGGYSSVSDFVFFASISESNFRGSGQSVTLKGDFGGRQNAELGYFNPWVDSRHTSLNLGIYDRLVLRQVSLTEKDVLYDEKRKGASVGLGRPLSDRTRAFLTLRWDDVSVANIDEEDKDLLVGSPFEPSNVRSLTLALVSDRRDLISNPSRGNYRSLSLETAGLFGGVTFDKYVGDLRFYRPLGKGNTFAARLVLGMTTGDPPFLEQFLLGGNDTLRGYRQDRFPGLRMALLNAEVRRAIGKSLIGVVFFDAGDAWGGDVAADPDFLGDATFSVHTSYGAGIRVKTPLGPLRLDYGIGEEGAETHFGIGHLF